MKIAFAFFAFLLSLQLPIIAQVSNLPSATNAASAAPINDAASTLPQNNFLSAKSLGGPLGVLFLAYVVGACGGLSYYMAVYYGFIDRNTRITVLEYMTTGRSMVGFVLLGGVVAAIFQAAQIDTLVPIQGFVLGATWPSVVNRMISGNAPAAAQLTSMINASDPATIPTPTGTPSGARPRSIQL